MRKKLSNAIVRPGKEAKDEEVAAYRKALGVPESKDDYLKVFPAPAEGETLEAEVLASRGKWAERFHAANIPAEAAKGLIAAVMEDAAAQQAAEVAADKRYAEEGDAALKVLWPGDEYKKNDTFANRAAEKIFGEDFDAVRKIEDKAGRFVLDNPIFKKALAMIGREMGEGTLGPVVSDTERETMDGQVRDIQKQIDEAQAKGDSTRANDLYQRKMALIAKRDGNQPIVGAQGRAA
jgi:hypothetical protein